MGKDTYDLWELVEVRVLSLGRSFNLTVEGPPGLEKVLENYSDGAYYFYRPASEGVYTAYAVFYDGEATVELSTGFTVEDSKNGLYVSEREVQVGLGRSFGFDVSSNASGDLVILYPAAFELQEDSCREHVFYIVDFSAAGVLYELLCLLILPFGVFLVLNHRFVSNLFGLAPEVDGGRDAVSMLRRFDEERRPLLSLRKIQEDSAFTRGRGRAAEADLLSYDLSGRRGRERSRSRMRSAVIITAISFLAAFTLLGISASHSPVEDLAGYDLEGQVYRLLPCANDSFTGHRTLGLFVEDFDGSYPVSLRALSAGTHTIEVRLNDRRQTITVYVNPPETPATTTTQPYPTQTPNLVFSVDQAGLRLGGEVAFDIKPAGAFDLWVDEPAGPVLLLQNYTGETTYIYLPPVEGNYSGRMQTLEGTYTVYFEVYGINEQSADWNVTIQSSEPVQGEVYIGEPVSWTQEFTLKNPSQQPVEEYVCLSLPVDSFEVRVLFGTESFDSACFTAQLDAGESATAYAAFKTSPVDLWINEDVVDLASLIPPDAFNISVYAESGLIASLSDSSNLSDAGLSFNLLQQEVTLIHNSSLHYHNITLQMAVSSESSAVDEQNRTVSRAEGEVLELLVDRLSNRTYRIGPAVERIQGRAVIGEMLNWTLRAGNLSIEYKTSAPEKTETETITNQKIVKSVRIQSNASVHYYNVSAYADLPETEGEIRLYWLVNDSRIDVTETATIADNKIYWIVPQLSEQEYEIEIDLDILTVQSYPVVGGNWTVEFNTTGKANLTIRASNGTEWDTDLTFLEVRCGDEILNYSWVGDAVFIENYSCNATGYEISRPLTEGTHILEFTFGNITKYAYNWATNLSDWTYRQTISISNTAGNLTNYQVRLDLNSSKVGGNWNWSNNGSDLRFTNSSEYLIDYWIENWSITGSNATIWVEVPFVENNTNTTIYMYYGNPTATSASNGTNTFDFFDDFTGSSVDSSRWTATGTHPVSDSIISITSPATPGRVGILGTTTFGYGYAQRSRVNPKSGVAGVGYYYDVWSDTIEMPTATHVVGYYQDPGQAFFFTTESSSTTSAYTRLTTWAIYESRRPSSSAVNGTVNDGTPLSISTNIATGNLASVFQINGNTPNAYTYDVDWVAIRKYSLPEPSVSYSSEQIRVSLGFAPPTPNNASSIITDPASINVSLNISGLDTFKFNWNGTNYSIYDKDLVLALNFNNNSAIGDNQSTAVDISRYGNNCSFYSDPVWTSSGAFGSALDFDGDDYLLCGNSDTLNVNGSMTVMAWVKLSSKADYRFILSKRNSGGTLMPYELIYHSGLDRFQIQSYTGTWYGATDTISPSTGVWYHLAGTYNGTNFTIYRNGVKTVGAGPTGSIPVNTANLAVGRSGDVSSSYMNGLVDEVRLYNRSFNDSEILIHYQSEFAKYNTTEYRFYANVTNLTAGTYTYYAWANDTTGNTNSSEVWTLTLRSFINLNFSSPTEENSSSITTNHTQINVTTYLTETLDRFTFNWNGTDYSIYDKDLLVALNFNNNSAIGDNGTYFVDISSYGRNGTCSSSTCPVCNSSGRMGGACWFDGSDDYISLGDFDLTTSKFSFEAWVNLKHFGSTQEILSKELVGTNYPEYVFTMVSNGSFICWFATADSAEGWGTPIASAYNISTANEWNHLACTYNGSEIRYYLNGRYNSTVSRTGTPYNNNLNALVGRTQGSGTLPLNGSIDELRVYNRSLNASEILMHYQSEFQKYNASEWRFYCNVTNLSSGTYTYYGWANDTIGSSNSTEVRTLSVDLSTPPELGFVLPTEDNDSIINRNWTEVNITINETDLDTFKFNWNGTNYSFYDSSLVLALNFNNNSVIGDNQTTAVDISRYGNNATVRGSALRFDGINDYVDCGNAESLRPSTFSVELWMNARTLNFAGSQGVISHGYPGMYWVEFYNTSTMRFYITNSTGGYQSAGAGSTVATNTWYHVVGIFNGTKVFLYLNGTLIHSGNAAGITSDTDNLWIGTGKGGTFGKYFNGSIDDVRIYNRALSSTEVSEHYQGVYNNETGRVLYIPFADLSGSTATDYSGQANHGTLTNFSSTAAGAGDTSSSGWTTYGRPTWTSQGKYGYGMVFDGRGDYLSVSDSASLNPASEITYMVWFRPFSLSTSDGILSKYIGSPTANRSYQITISDSNETALRAVLSDDGTYTAGHNTVVQTPNGSISSGSWQHAAVTFKGGEHLRIYINGVETVSNTSGVISSLYNNAETLKIGVDYNVNDANRYFNGSIDEVRIYNRSLNASEILMHYQSEFQKYNASEWRFYCNVTNLSDGNYMYYGWANDTSGNSNQTEIRSLTYVLPPINVSLVSPVNWSGDNYGNVTFVYNFSGVSSVSCSLVFNGSLNATNSSLSAGVNQNFTINNLRNGSYNWSVNCSSESSNGSSGTRFFDVILTTGFSGNTTDFSGVNVSDIGNFTLHIPGYGMIVYNESVNLSGGVNLSALVNLSSNHVSVDSVSENRLNKSARIWLYNLPYLYHPVIIRNGALCSAAYCIFDSYSGRNLSFNVSQFTSYAAGANSNLTVFDENDPLGGGLTKAVYQEVLFYANYSNSTDGSSINGSGVYCNISFNISGSWTAYYNMSFDATSKLYYYSQTFYESGAYQYNISCNGSALSYEPLNATDAINIENLGPNLNFSYPTEDNDTTIERNWTQINVTIQEPSLDAFKFNWNGSNYSFYDDSLVLALNFNNNSEIGDNQTTTVDISRYGNNATVRGSALKFDGTNDWVNLTVTDNTMLGADPSGWSVEAWFKTSDLPVVDGDLVSSYYSSSTDSTYAILLGVLNVSGVAELWSSVRYDGTTTSLYTGRAVNDDVWHHAVLTVSKTSNNASLYLDGVLADSDVAPSTTGDYTDGGRILLGARVMGSAVERFYNGYLDEVRIYNRTLSAGEVSEHYNGVFNDESAKGLYIPFANASGTVATDFSGYGRHGTLTSFTTTAGAGDTGASGWTTHGRPTWTDSGRYGYAMSYNGIDDYLNVSDSSTLNIADNLTIEAWVNLGSTSVNYYESVFISKDADSSGYSIRIGDARVNFVYGNGTAWLGHRGVTQFSLGEWHHLAVTFDKDDYIRGYLDGVLDNSTLASGAIAANSYAMNLGRRMEGTRFFNGSIDELRIYNRSLNASEILMHYQSEFSKYNSTEYRFYCNVTNITKSGNYTYYGWANDTYGNFNLTETRNLSVVLPFPVNFTSPTEDNDSTIYLNSSQVNLSISPPNDLDSFKFNWNGSNYSFYDDSLVLALNFNNNSEIGDNQTTAVDISKYGNNATIRGYALDFDGTNDYVKVIDDSSIEFSAGQNFTVEAWVKTVQPMASGKYPIIVSKEGGATRSGYNMVLHSSTTDSRWYFEIFVSGTQYSIQGCSDVADGTWHHLVGMRNGSTLLVYQDGVFCNDSAASSGTVVSTYNLSLGAYQLNNHYFDGTMDDVRIYGRSLSATEVEEHYKGVYNDDSGLVLYMPFSDGEYFRVSDYSDYNNYGDMPYYVADAFTSSESWTENQITGSASGGYYVATLTSTSDPYFYKDVTDFDESFDRLQFKYKSYPGGPARVGIYYTDGTDCSSFNAACGQSFNLINDGEWHLIDKQITDAEWIDNDGTIDDIRFDFDSASTTGTIYVDYIVFRNGGEWVTYGRPTWTNEGRYGYGMQFNGLDDYLSIPDSSDLSGGAGKNFTWMFWFKTSNISSSNYLLSKYYNFSAKDWGISCSNQQMVFLFENPSNPDPPSIASNSVITETDKWYHAAVTFNGSNKDVRLYVDGVLSGNGTARDDLYDTANEVDIGAGGYLGGFHEGAIDEIRIYRRTLDASEILMHYQSEFQKYNSSEYRFYCNVTNLSDGTYTYYGWANDTSGNINLTEVRTLSVDMFSPPELGFVSPTEDNDSIINRNWAEVNITINETSLDNFKFNWNGTNYSFYDDSLILAYNFNNNSAIGENSTLFVDVSEYGNNGNCNSSGSACPTYTSSGKYAGACVFDGSNDYIYTPASFQLDAGNFTISAWFNASTSGEIFGHYWGGGAVNRMFVSDTYGGRIAAYISDSNLDRADVVSDTVVIDGQWHHVSLVRDNSENKLSLYLDGVLVAYNDSSSVGDVDKEGYPYTLGIRCSTLPCGSPSVILNGSIDEVRIYNRSLNASEILMHYQSEFSKYNGTQYRLYINVTNITKSGNYTYYAWANDTFSNYNLTEVRNLSVVLPFPVNFSSPTEDNDSTIYLNSSEVNVSINPPNDLDSFKFNWNGSSYYFRNDSLVLAYNFNNYSGIGDSASNVVDVSGSGYTGSISGCAYVPGRYNSALNFTGSSYLGAGHVLDNVFAGADKKFSMTMWVKPSTTMTNNGLVQKVADSNCGEDQRQFSFRLGSSSQLEFLYYCALTASAYRSVIGSTSITDTSLWYHVAFTYDGSVDTNDGLDRVKLYVDGVAESTSLSLNTGTLGNIQDGTAHLGLGKSLTSSGSNCSSSNYFNGYMDELRIWEGILSPQEVFMHYQSEFSKYNSTEWMFYCNVTNLSDGTYTYYGWANDTSGNSNSSEVRSLTVSLENAPVVSSVVLNDSDGGTVQLSVLDTLVWCNASVSDENGWEDVVSANATLYHLSSSLSAADDNNVHYSNSSCLLVAGTGIYRNVSCGFELEHEALNGSWNCTVTVKDTGGLAGNATGNNTVDELIAISLLESEVSFGSLAPGANTSVNQSVNVTNLGNILLDVQVNGSDMDCTVRGTIPVNNTRYGLSSATYDEMSLELSTTATSINTFDLGVEGAATSEDLNATKLTYWNLIVPASAEGVCRSNITITAVAG